MFAVGSAPRIRAATQIIAALEPAQRITHIIGHGVISHDICILENRDTAFVQVDRHSRTAAAIVRAMVVRARNRPNPGPPPEPNISNMQGPTGYVPSQRSPRPLVAPAEDSEMLPPQGYRGRADPIRPVVPLEQRVAQLEAQVQDLTALANVFIDAIKSWATRTKRRTAPARETGPPIRGKPYLQTPLILLRMGDASMAQVEALQSAFLALLEIAEESRAENVLKRAIAGLAVVENRPLVGRGPIVAGDDLAAWYDLKIRIRGSGVALAEIAGPLNMSKSAIDHILTPGAPRAPSKATVERLKTWLGARQKPKTVASGAHITATRLDEADRAALQKHYGHLKPYEIKRRRLVDVDLFNRAVSGAIVPIEVISRLTAVLATSL